MLICCLASIEVSQFRALEGFVKYTWRWATKVRTGGAKVIYFLATAERIYLILAYPKSVKDSLTPAEKAALKTLTYQLKREVSK